MLCKVQGNKKNVNLRGNDGLVKKKNHSYFCWWLVNNVSQNILLSCASCNLFHNLKQSWGMSLMRRMTLILRTIPCFQGTFISVITPVTGLRGRHYRVLINRILYIIYVSTYLACLNVWITIMWWLICNQFIHQLSFNF